MIRTFQGEYSDSRTAPCGNGCCDGACIICDPPRPCLGCNGKTRDDSGYCRKCRERNGDE